MGVLKAQQKQTEEESIQYFEKALKLANDSKEEVYEINVLVNLALVFERRGEIETAIQKLEEALKIDNDNQKIKQKVQQLKLLMNK